MTSITPDTPIIDPSQDKFNRWPFAQRIAQTTASRKDQTSIIIGIYGSWGDGKTTVLNFIEQELRQHPNVVSLKFNPWCFSDETKMLLGFYHSLADVIGKSETTTKERIGEWMGKYLPTFASAIGQGETVENLSKLLSSVEIEEMKSRVNEILRNGEKRVVILIDDIDRLDKNEIQSLFRLVKLNADFVNTAYILAFDDEMVAAALQEKYSAAGPESGHSFLEKIIQVPLDLPAIPTTSLRGFCFSKVSEALNDADIALSEEETQAFVRCYIDGLEIRVKTPRIATRYSNIIAFSLPILKGEVNPVDLMLIEGIRLFYPKLYETIKKHPDLFLGKNLSSNYKDSAEQEKKRTQDLIESGLLEHNVDEKRDVISLLQSLFPRLKGVYGNTTYGHDWDVAWAKSKQIASKDYFSRYFSYSITETDVSDTVLDTFIKSLGEKTAQEAVNAFSDLLTPNNIEKVISKLRQKSEYIPAGLSMILASLLAGMGKKFPNPNQLFSFKGPFSQAAMLVSNLVLNIPDKEERIKFAKRIIAIAEPITFAAEITRWFRDEKASGNLNCFTADEKLSLRKLVAARIKEECTHINIFSEFPDDAGILLSVWTAWGSGQEQSSYLEALLKENPTQVNFLFNNIVPTSWSMETGVGSVGDLDQNIYNNLCKMIEPARIMEALEQVFGDDLITEEYQYEFPGEDTNLRLAQQFAWIHRKVEQEGQNGKQNPEEIPN